MIQISEHFTYKKLLRYTFPSMVMMVFTSIYGVVDGLFISNFTGKTAFAAVNFIYPFLMILGGVGFMFGSGGSALVAKTLGEGNRDKANQIFSALCWTSGLTGVVLAVLGFIFLRPVASLLGAEGQLLEDCIVYGRVFLIGIPASVIQYEFQNLFATADKPKLGLWSTVASGVMNIILDALFVGVFRWNLEGAAAATVLSQTLGAVVPLVYFGRKNTSLLRLTKPGHQGKAMLKICTNGISELLNNISMSVVSIIYNAQLLRYAGEDGISAYGVIMYVEFLFISIFIGYFLGVAPVISYHFGARNQYEIKSLLRKSLGIITAFSLVMFVLSELSAGPISKIFVGYDQGLFEMTKRGFLLFSFCYLFSGFAAFGSSFFTALNNGILSAVLSVMRTVVFQILMVLVLPHIWDLDGIWVSTAVSEFLAAVLSIAFIAAKRKKYNY